MDYSCHKTSPSSLHVAHRRPSAKASIICYLDQTPPVRTKLRPCSFVGSGEAFAKGNTVGDLAGVRRRRRRLYHNQKMRAVFQMNVLFRADNHRAMRTL